VLFCVVVGSFIAIQNYLKRGLQGRWRDAVDGLGDQYDPRTADSSTDHVLTSTTSTQIMALDTGGGYWTQRMDQSASTESTTGTTTVGAY
jgi:hypothetical protein